MDGENLIAELRADRLLRALADESREVNERFERQLAPADIGDMFGSSIDGEDVIERNRASFFKAEIVNPWTQSRRNDRNDEEPIELETLEKREVGSRRRAALKGWMSRELATGRSAQDLIDHASEHDVETAELLTEIAEELALES